MYTAKIICVQSSPFLKTYHIRCVCVIIASLLTTQYIEELFVIGEAKSGVFNLLVTHMLDTWTNHLVDCTHDHSSDSSSNETSQSPNTTTSLSSSIEGGSPGLRDLAMTEAVIASMKALVDLLIKAVLFGPVHKKNIRSVCYIQCILDYLNLVYPNPQLSKPLAGVIMSCKSHMHNQFAYVSMG